MIILDENNHPKALVGTAYGVKYYGIKNGQRETSFCRLRLFEEVNKIYGEYFIRY